MGIDVVPGFLYEATKSGSVARSKNEEDDEES